MGTDESRPAEPRPPTETGVSPPADSVPAHDTDVEETEPLLRAEDDEDGDRPYALAADGYDEDPLAPEVAKPALIGPARHAASLVLALVAVPAALLLIDYANTRWVEHAERVGVSADPDVRAVSALALGAGVLFLVAWLCRVSPLGPLVAGLVWGWAPWVAVTFYPRRVEQGIADLPSVYDGIGTTVNVYGFVAFAVVGALLVGSAFGASWRDR